MSAGQRKGQRVGISKCLTDRDLTSIMRFSSSSAWRYSENNNGLAMDASSSRTWTTFRLFSVASRRLLQAW